MRNCLFIFTLLLVSAWSKPVELLVLKPSVQGLDKKETAIFYKSMLMVFNQQGYFQVPSNDEILNSYRELGYMRPPHCFNDFCFLNAGRDLKKDLVLGSFGEKSGNRLRVNFKLYGVKEEAILWSETFEFEIENAQDFIGSFKSVLQEMIGYQQSDLKKFEKVETDYSQHYGWSLFGGALLSGWMIYEFGPWANKQEIETKLDSDNLIYNDRPLSGLRGFYASRPLGARYRAMGGAGITLIKGALAPMWNPAGVANLNGQEFKFSREVLPGDVPKQFIGYSAPLTRNLYHAQALQYEGDDLAKEILYYSSYATDLSLFSTYFNEVQAGVNLKGYLIEVGAKCVGVDCSRGSGYGGGIDLGLQWSINSSVRFGATLKDPWSHINYENEFTGNSYSESLPPLLLAGVSYEFDASFSAALDVQKSLYADQKDRISLGLEKKLFDFIWTRGGIYQISDYDDFRIWTLGFGINEAYQGYIYSINYHFEYADEDAILFQGQQSFDFGLHF